MRLGALLLAIVLGSSSVATLASHALAAEPSAAERETARGLLKEGDWLDSEGRHKEALERYRAAHAIMGLPTTGMSVVRCLAATGRLVEARDLAIRIARSAPLAQDNELFAAARADAQSTAARLEPRIPDVTLRVLGVSDTASAQVRIDGVELPRVALGQPWKVDPGEHEIEATAPGMSKARLVRQLAEGDHATIELALSPLAASSPVPPSPTAPPLVAPQPRDSSPAADGAQPARRPPLLGYAITGIGAASLTAGLVFGWKALERKGFRDDHCDSTGCDPEGLDADADGRKWATWSTVAAGVGALAIGAGLYLAISSSGAGKPSAATLHPTGRGAALTVHW